MGLVQIIFLLNVFYSLFFGPKAGRNPWESNSLEWETISPPPHGNFETTPIVLRGPYEYGVADAPGGRISQTGIVQTEGLPTIPQGSQA